MQCNLVHISARMARIVLLLGLTITLGACMKRVEHPPLTVTFLPERGDFISNEGDQLTFEEIIGMARGKDYILLGEGHKSVCDHKIQQRIFSALATSDAPPSLGLEMVAVDMQPVLDDFNAGKVEVADLEERLQWKTKWGYPFSLFKGLFTVAAKRNLPVAGLNTPTRVTRKVGREGLESLTKEERALMPSEIVPPAKEQLDFLNMVFAQHQTKGMKDGSQRERFRLVQSIWDSKMAEEAVRLRKEQGRPVLVIAGSAHVEHGWGIARRLNRFDPEAEILLFTPWRGGEFQKEEGDAFFYCPDTYESRMGATLAATGTKGLLVQRVQRDSRAAKAGLRPGDVLLEAAGIKLDHLFSLHMAGAKVHSGKAELVFTVRRGEETFTVNLGELGATGSSMRPAR